MGGGHRGGMGGGSGMVPFRAGDWKCGSEGCGYHNFAKNVSCLRCGASRAGAAVVADSSFTSPMDQPPGYGMGPPSMTATPGPAFAPTTGGYGSAAFGAPTYGGPASNYTLPAGLGPAGAWPINPQPFASGNVHAAGPFDSRAAQAAFTSAGMDAAVSNGPSNGAAYNTTYGDVDGNDPFNFLNTSMGNLNMGDNSRRNGANPNRGSPS